MKDTITKIRPKMDTKYSEDNAFEEFSSMCYEQHKERYPSANINMSNFKKISFEKWKEMTDDQKKMFSSNLKAKKSPSSKSRELQTKYPSPGSTMDTGITRACDQNVVEEDDDSSVEEQDDSSLKQNLEDPLPRKRRSAAISIGSMAEPNLNTKMRRSTTQLSWESPVYAKSVEKKFNKKKIEVINGPDKILKSTQKSTRRPRVLSIEKGGKQKELIRKLKSTVNGIGIELLPAQEYRCEPCQFYFSVIKLHERHQESMHGNIAANKEINEAHNEANCEVCEYCISTFIKLAKHQKASHKENQWDILDHRKYGRKSTCKRIVLARFFKNIQAENKRIFKAYKVRALNRIAIYKGRGTQQAGKHTPKKEEQNQPGQGGSDMRNTPSRLFNHILISLQERDKDQIFFNPVTEDVAPGYFSVVKEPMDLKTMNEKVLANKYSSLEEFRADFKLICKNAMLYNETLSPMYMRASRFKKIGLDLMSDDSAQYFRDMIGKEDENGSILAPNKSMILKTKDCLAVEQVTEDPFDPIGHAPVNDKLETSYISHTESDISIRESDLEKQTPFNKLLFHFLSLFKEKDEENIFAKPVTEKIAPGYFDLVKHPMDLLTMTKNVQEGRYSSFQEFISDFDQICKNALLYNISSSIFYKKAKELKTYGNSILSKRNIRSLKEELPYILEIPFEQLGFTTFITPKPINNQIKTPQRPKNDADKENDTEISKENDAEELSEYEKLRLRNIAMRKQMMADVIQDSIEVSQSMGSKRKKLLCMQCDYVTDSTYKLEGHVNYAHENKTPFKCDHCEYETAFEMNLSRHVKFEHYDRVFKCETCDMVTPSKTKLRIHSDSCEGATSQTSEESSDGNTNIQSQCGYEEILNANLPPDEEGPMVEAEFQSIITEVLTMAVQPPIDNQDTKVVFEDGYERGIIKQNYVNLKKVNTLALGRRKSGRFWKSERSRFRSNIKSKGLQQLCDQKRLAQKQQYLKVREYEKKLREDAQRVNHDKRQRTMANKKRKEENEKKNEIIQIIRNPAKIKRIKKKQLRMLAKRDVINVE